MSSPLGFLLASEPPSRRVGVIVAVVSVALCTLIVYPLKHVAPVVSLTVVYLPAVLVVSVIWGGWLGVATAVLSAAAFNFFHLPPVGHFTIRDSSNWVALVAFLVVAGLASSVAEVTRARTRDAEERRREADLAAEMARLLLRGESLAEALPTAAARLAQALELSSAAIEMEAVDGDERSVAFPLREGTSRLGTLLVGADTSEASLRRLQERVVPALEALLSAALERERLLGGVVETAALRRADTVKTALLRAVSHDLRSPLTAISAAGEAVGSPSLSHAGARGDGGGDPGGDARLSRLVDNLLDLSRLEAGAAEPRRDWTSVEELIRAAVAELAARPGGVQPVDRPRAAARERRPGADGARVRERARERPPALRRAPGVGARPRGARAGALDAPSVGERRRRRAAEGDGSRPAGGRVIVRIVDRGPGIPPAQLERVFEPFYRAGTAGGGHRGSGLGLAIARGFTEANAGTLHVESLPGQGATFVFELPLARTRRTAAPATTPATGSSPASRVGRPAQTPAPPSPSGRTPGA